MHFSLPFLVYISVCMQNLFRYGLKELAWGSAIPFDRFLCQVGAARIPYFPLVFLTRSELSEKTSRLYKVRQDLYLHDPRNISNVGDIVLARKLQEFLPFPQTFDSPKDWDLMDKEIWFEIEKIVFKAGEIIDPITGRKCNGTKFVSSEIYNREEINSKKLEEPSRFFEEDYLYPSERRPWPLETQDTLAMKDEVDPELEPLIMTKPKGWIPRRKIKRTYSFRRRNLIT